MMKYFTNDESRHIIMYINLFQYFKSFSDLLKKKNKKLNEAILSEKIFLVSFKLKKIKKILMCCLYSVVREWYTKVQLKSNIF